MLLNRLEYHLMNNPVREMIQRRVEAKQLLRMGGALDGGRALEVGCGRGVGVELILDLFGAKAVDAFDLDPRMVALARRRLGRRGEAVRLWVGDATAVPAPDATYDAVFDFGIIHHVPPWRLALAEVARVLKPGGRFYAEEMLRPFICNPVVRCFLEHPQQDRFDADDFRAGLAEVGLTPTASRMVGRLFGWFVASKPTGPNQPLRLTAAAGGD